MIYSTLTLEFIKDFFLNTCVVALPNSLKFGTLVTHVHAEKTYKVFCSSLKPKVLETSLSCT